MTLRCPEAAATRIKRGAGVLVLGEGASDESFLRMRPYLATRLGLLLDPWARLVPRRDQRVEHRHHE
ncbi:MAG TPA: hypothetical protein VFB61_11895 [Gemmatimonadales bacterium]|nr:hypothetical protein [Gemmatimonadales bacterium]